MAMTAEEVAKALVDADLPKRDDGSGWALRALGRTVDMWLVDRNNVVVPGSEFSFVVLGPVPF